MVNVIKAGGARGISLISSLIFTALASRVVFQAYGATAFGIVTFIASLQYLIPFADLGLGAVIMNRVALARAEGAISRSYSAIFRSVKIQLVFASSVMIAVVGAALVIGPAVHLADSDSIPTLALAIACLIVLANVPLSFGNRVLIGLDLTHKGIFISAVAPPLVLSGVGLCSLLGVSAAFLYPIWPLATLLTSLIISSIGLKRLGLGVGQLVTGIQRTKARNRSEPIWGTAVSMLSISIASPLTHNSHRLVLGASTIPQALATYSLGAQIFSPLLSLITSAATPLWSHFASTKGTSRSLLGTTGIFGLVGCIAAGLLFVVTPIYAWFITGTAFFVPWAVISCFAAFLIVNALALPSMMRLNTGVDIKFQAWVTSAACVVGLPFSFWAAFTWGTQGPLIASAAAMAIIQLIPMLFWQLSRKGQIPE